MARAGYRIDDAANFWRRMAISSPGSITMTSDHPATPERFVALQSAVMEIRAKAAQGAPLLPKRDGERGECDGFSDIRRRVDCAEPATMRPRRAALAAVAGGVTRYALRARRTQPLMVKRLSMKRLEGQRTGSPSWWQWLGKNRMLLFFGATSAACSPHS